MLQDWQGAFKAGIQFDRQGDEVGDDPDQPHQDDRADTQQNRSRTGGGRPDKGEGEERDTADRVRDRRGLYRALPRLEASGFFDPFRSAHYEDSAIQKTYTPEFLTAHKESMADSIPDLYLPGQGEYFSALRENLVRADAGQQSAKRALDLTAKQWEQTTRRLGRSAQAEQWAFLRRSYPENTRDALQ